jgi:hypothetical protein
MRVTNTSKPGENRLEKNAKFLRKNHFFHLRGVAQGF